MPRDAAGTYTLPAGNPVVTNTTITSNRENTTNFDIAAELTNSLDRQGRGGMTGPFKIFDGTEAAPGLAFTSDPDNGMYRIGPDNWAFSVGAAKTLELTPTGVVVPAGKTLTAGGNLVVQQFLIMNPGTQIRAADGTMANPGYSFNAEIGSGLWRVAAGVVRMAIAGVDIWETSNLGFGILSGKHLNIVSGQLFTDAAFPLRLFAGGAEQFRVTNLPSAQNIWIYQGSPSGQPLAAFAAGADPHIGLEFASKGFGNIAFRAGNNHLAFSVRNDGSSIAAATITATTTYTGNDGYGANRTGLVFYNTNVRGSIQAIPNDRFMFGSETNSEILFFAFNAPQVAILPVAGAINYITLAGGGNPHITTNAGNLRLGGWGAIELECVGGGGTNHVTVARQNNPSISTSGGHLNLGSATGSVSINGASVASGISGTASMLSIQDINSNLAGFKAFGGIHTMELSATSVGIQMGALSNGPVIIIANSGEVARFVPPSGAHTGGLFIGATATSVNQEKLGVRNLNNNQVCLYLASHADTFPYGARFAFTLASPNSTATYFLICSDTLTDRMIVYANGNIVNTNNSYGSTSDLRLKFDIEDAGSQLEDFRKYRFRSFKMKANPALRQLGLIAQEVESISPGLLELDDKGYFSLKYSVLAIKGMKALQENILRVDNHEARIAALEGKVH